MIGSLESVRAGATTRVDHHFLNRIPALAEAPSTACSPLAFALPSRGP
jgi:hypothetical protein